MKQMRYLPALTTAALVAALVGCEAERSVLVESYPMLAPIIGGRPEALALRARSR